MNEEEGASDKSFYKNVSSDPGQLSMVEANGRTTGNFNHMPGTPLGFTKKKEDLGCAEINDVRNLTNSSALNNHDIKTSLQSQNS